MGEFNVEIMFQKDSGTGKDSFGQPIENWEDFIPAYAKMVTTGGREFYTAQRLNAETTAVFELWYEPGIDAKMRIRYGDRFFSILPPINNVNEQNRKLLISAKEVI